MQLNVLTPSGEQKFGFIAFLYVFQCALLITFLDYALKEKNLSMYLPVSFIPHIFQMSFIYSQETCKHTNAQTHICSCTPNVASQLIIYA